MTLWDPIRRQRVAATPEERVRQSWLRKMVSELGYPQSLLSIEKGLGALSHQGFSQSGSAPERRVDLLCYTPGKWGLIPLLLVEFKAGPIDAMAERQLLGYNDSVGALFIALASQWVAKTVWRTKEGFSSVPFIPLYSQLVEKI